MYQAEEQEGLGNWQHNCSSSICRSHQQSFCGHASGTPHPIASASGIPRGELRPSIPALSLVPTVKHKQAGLLSTVSMSLGLPQDRGGLRWAPRQLLVQGLLLYPNSSWGGLRSPLFPAKDVLAELGRVHTTPTGCSHAEPSLKQPF